MDASKPRPPRKPRHRNNNRRPGGGANSTANPNNAANTSNNNNNNAARAPAPARRSGPPPPPQLRVTCRNIGNVEKNGNVVSLGALLQAVVDKANEKLNTKMHVDAESIEACRIVEEAVLEVRQKFDEEMKCKENSETKEEVAPEMAADGNVAPETVPTDTVLEETSKTAPFVNSSPSSAPANNAFKISVQVLYMVPPKKTRRRGEKPGCIHLVLHAPPLPTTAQVTNKVKEDSQEATSIAPTPSTTADYSTELAKRRTMLHRALDLLSAAASDDAKSKQDYASMIVVESPCQKAWKRGAFKDRLDGTIFTTPAYQDFFALQQKEAEARSARPRPAPGGTVTATAATATVSHLAGVAAVNEDGQAVSHLVQHLLQKKKSAAPASYKQVAKKTIAGKDQTAAKPAGKTTQQKPPAATKVSAAASQKRERSRPKKSTKKVGPNVAAVKRPQDLTKPPANGKASSAVKVPPGGKPA
jgi:hypothetical protein